MNLFCFGKNLSKCFTRPSMILTASVVILLPAIPAVAADLPNVGDKFTAPDSPRATYNFNPGWKFTFGDVTGADQPGFDDSAWADVSLPHTWNETDSYQKYISHGGGDQSEKLGIGWYRKHFKLPASAEGQKVFLEFDGLRQAGHFFLNGQAIGLYENGVNAYGLDISKLAKFGDQDNVLAVQVDNRTNYKEEATGTPFEWNAKDFNPDFGGLNRDATLIIAGKIYQTLPLYYGLQTSGVYVYGQNYDIPGKKADINVEAEVRNETSDHASVTLSAVVVDADGVVRAKLDGKTADLADGQTQTFTASGSLANAQFWDINSPYLYDVYSVLSVNGKVADVVQTHTGFRKVEFKGGAGTGGVWLNDHFVWLTGYSQRSANDWPGLGGAYPDWLHDFTAALIRASNGNYVRWMHVSPQRADVEACDKFGIAIVCPAGDKEKDATGRQWDQRAEVMRNSMIFFRNNPSILFYEAGNTYVTPDQMAQLIALRNQWDPHGERVVGTRDGGPDATITAVSEYYGVMIGQDPQTDTMTQPGQMFRGYSVDRRDKAPLVETEDFRDEAARGIWDDFSPPHFGFKPKGTLTRGDPGAGQDTYHWNSETFAVAAANRYASYVLNRIDNPDPLHSKWSGYASIYFSDSDADGRQDGSEVLRVSGKVDGVRLPKELFFVSRVMQSSTPDLHIIGHWTYPAGTKKTMYVAATLCDQVELFVNGQSQGVQKLPCTFVDPFNNRSIGYTGFVYAFPDIAFEPGSIKAVATKNGQIVAQQEIKTAGAPASIRLTVHTGPKGLQADGSDDALIDFEVVDADGNRCPTDEARVDFAVNGPVVWRGGFCSDQLDSTNNLYLDTECGINRVAIRSTLTPGTITIKATRDGLTPATVTIDSHAVSFKDGLDTDMPVGLAGLSQPVPNLVP
jgi:beta-galactosidase